MADLGQATGTPNDVVPLGVRQLTESGAAFNLVAMRLDEFGQTRLEKSHLGSSADDVSAGNQALPSPSPHCPRRHTEPTAHFFNRQDRLRGLVDRLPDSR